MGPDVLVAGVRAVGAKLFRLKGACPIDWLCPRGGGVWLQGAGGQTTSCLSGPVCSLVALGGATMLVEPGVVGVVGAVPIRVVGLVAVVAPVVAE